MIEYRSFIDELKNTDLERLTEGLDHTCQERLSIKRFGDLPGWLEAMAAIPKDIQTNNWCLSNAVKVGDVNALNQNQRDELEHAFRALIPWRKGPFELFGLHIDTEWRSDWKWDRVLPHIRSLKDKDVLDVGCGNGYHCWRMSGAGARRVIGIDPSPRFIVQFEMVKTLFSNPPKVDVLPLGIDDLPPNLSCFDTTFSMGVLYHRRSPIDHLLQLKDTLKDGGQLVLETLTVDGNEHTVLVPPERYAMMNNVWFLPSPLALELWLKKCGFKNVACVDVNTTQLAEQRQTDWMQFHSLEQFLDPNDLTKTAEGHPAPQRSVFVAEK